MRARDEPEGGNGTPDILIQIWENWRSGGGKGTCDGCPAHWNHRTDLREQPGERTSSYGFAPYYGLGDFDAEVVVLGREPGPHTQKEKDLTELTFSERHQPNVRKVAKSSHGTIQSLKPLFETLVESAIPTYWTQLRKCNQFPNDADKDEDAIRDRCCGLNPSYPGYLQQELDAIAPDYVIPLGKVPSNKLLKLFDVPIPYSNFSKFTLSGNDNSGFNPITHQNLPFTVIPIAHPSQGYNWIKSRLESVTTLDERGITKIEYYKAVAEDLLRYKTC